MRRIAVTGTDTGVGKTWATAALAQAFLLAGRGVVVVKPVQTGVESDEPTDADEIKGLESGANDYLTKPFRYPVLLARINAALRQRDQSEDAVFTIGQYSFQPAAKVLEASDGNKVRLTDKETSILKYLYRQGPKTITRDVLLKEVWGYNNRVTTHTLETHIYRLRQKIERDPSNARLLVTEDGGYRLVP